MDEFWEKVRQIAEMSRRRPAWEKAGITLNPKHYETYEPKKRSPPPQQ